MTTAQEAKDQIIYVIENGEVEATNLYDHVMASATEVTSLIGVSNQIFVEEVEILEDGMEEAIIKYAVKDWGRNAHNRTAKTIELFDTEEEAEDECFRLHETYDFANDDQRDTQYWSTKEEAEQALAGLNA